MKLILLLLVFFAPFISTAQSMFGIKAGIGSTRVNINQYNNTGQTARTGFTGGITYDYYLANGFSFGGELLYQQRGYGLGLIITDEVNHTTTNFGFKAKQNYIALPLKASYTFGQKWFGFISAGVLPAFVVKAIDHTLDPSTGQARNVDAKTATNGLDFGLLGEIGGGYKFDRNRLYISIAGNSSFSDMYTSDLTAHHRGITFSVGIKRRIVM